MPERPDLVGLLGETGAYVHSLWTDLFAHSGTCDCQQCGRIRAQLSEFMPLYQEDEDASL